jgi:hypothetical protein
MGLWPVFGLIRTIEMANPQKDEHSFTAFHGHVRRLTHSPIRVDALNDPFTGYLWFMKGERPDDAQEAMTDARRRSRQAAIVAIETYLATRTRKEEPARKHTEATPST